MKTLLSLFAVALVACTDTKSPPPPRVADTTTITSAIVPTSCPLGVEGAGVVYEDTDAGGRLTFTAPPGKVEDLRRRARDAAAMYGTAQHLGEGHEGRHGTGANHGLRATQLPPAYGGEVDLDGGARIDVTPVDPTDLPVLRAKLRQRAVDLMTSCE